MIPTVSIFMMTKNCSDSMGRSLRSLQNLDYDPAYLEFVFQDASDDGDVREAIENARFRNYTYLRKRSYQDLHLEFHSAIQHCNGTYTMSCQADEELLPSSVLTLSKLMQERRAAMAYGAVQLTDRFGNKIADPAPVDRFDIWLYLAGVINPCFASMIFDTKTLKEASDIGVRFPNSTELPLVSYCGQRICVETDEVIAKYAVHDNEVSVVHRELLHQGRMNYLRAGINPEPSTRMELMRVREERHRGNLIPFIMPSLESRQTPSTDLSSSQ